MELPLLIVLTAAALILSLVISAIYLSLRCRRRTPVDLEQPVTHKPDPTAPHRFTWSEVETLTTNFSQSNIIGSGGFSTVYLSSTLAAFKVHRCSERLHRAFRNELTALLRLRHPNIVTLLGYSDGSPEDGALVLEYVPNGTLHDHLHGSGAPPLPWPRRTSIAVQLATAVQYLHDECNPQLVHGDLKSSNVLLDNHLAPKLCDFGSAQIGFSAVVSAAAASDRKTMMGSPGYVDPHYLRTGMVSKKSDIYSFGVLLLELVTGAEAFGDRPLAAVVGEMVREGRSGEIVVDVRLGGEYDKMEAAAVVEVAASCVGEQPSLRPAMRAVVEVAASCVGEQPSLRPAMREVVEVLRGKLGNGW